MKNKFKTLQISMLVFGLITPVLFFMNAQLSFAQAIPIPDPLRPNTSSTSSPLPKYDKGVDVSIRDYLCTPEGNGTDLFNCIGKLTRVAITAGAIVLVFMIVLAGYMYIAGGETQKSKAKSMVFSSLTGMAIILTSFMLLNFINPALTQIKTIQPPIFKSANLPKCEEIGFSTDCIISTGPSEGQVFNVPVTARGCSPIESGICTKQNISVCPAFSNQIENALKACNQESGGKASAWSGTDKCILPDGSKRSFSYGMWQINLLYSTNPSLNEYSAGPEFDAECKGVLIETGKGPGCITGSGASCVRTRYCQLGPGGQAAMDRCEKAMTDVIRQNKQACALYNKRGWQPWPYTKKVCNLP